MINKTILEECHSKGFSKNEIYGAYKIFFGTLVSEPRLKIINLLRKGEKTVSEIVEELKTDQTSTSHNLARLRKCGFVKVKVNGKFRCYNLNEESIKPLMDIIDKHMNKHCLKILKKLSETEKRRMENEE